MEWGFIGIMVIKWRFCQRMPLLIDPAQIKSGLLKKEKSESLRWMRWSYTQFVFLFPREPLFPLPPICQSSCPSSSSETTPPLFSPKHRLSRPDWQVYTRRKVVETAPVDSGASPDDAFSTDPAPNDLDLPDHTYKWSPKMDWALCCALQQFCVSQASRSYNLSEASALA